MDIKFYMKWGNIVEAMIYERIYDECELVSDYNYWKYICCVVDLEANEYKLMHHIEQRGEIDKNKILLEDIGSEVFHKFEEVFSDPFFEIEVERFKVECGW